MKRHFLLFTPLVLVSACSETNLDDLGAEEIAETEKQVEADAKSLEEAANEAVKVLDEEIQAELDDEGVGSVTDEPQSAEIGEGAEE